MRIHVDPTWNRLFLIRHGENIANLTLEFSHRKVDYDLTNKGMLQAQQTAACLRDQSLQEVYSSPLRRALQTAKVIAAEHSTAVTVLEEFREVNVGDFEGQKPTAALWREHNAIIDAWLRGEYDTRFPGGETSNELLERARRGFQSVLRGKAGRSIAIVAHGGIFSFSLPRLCANFDLSLLNGGMGNCSISELYARVVGDQLEMEVLRFADISHLSGDAARLVTGLPE